MSLDPLPHTLTSAPASIVRWFSVQRLSHFGRFVSILVALKKMYLTASARFGRCSAAHIFQPCLLDCWQALVCDICKRCTYDPHHTISCTSHSLSRWWSWLGCYSWREYLHGDRRCPQGSVSLSGQYCLLSRILYYALLIFSVFGHAHVWLIAGALALALTYSGTAAIMQSEWPQTVSSILTS